MPFFKSGSAKSHVAARASRKGCGSSRLACGVLKLWFLGLFVAALAALVAKWLDEPRVAVPAIVSNGGETGTPDAKNPDDAARAEIEALRDQFRPRTVSEMLKDLDDGDEDPASGGVAVAPGPPPANAGGGDYAAATGEDAAMNNDVVDVSDEFAALIQEARYAQIEGDMRKAIIKLEQANEIAPDHPVLCYYFGLTYEFLRNAAKSREAFAKVVAQREKAGRFYQLAAIHLERGFSSPADKRGDIAFGTILEFREGTPKTGEHVVLTVPVRMKDGLNIRASELRIPIRFYHSVNDKSVDIMLKEEPQIKWLTEPVDWADGEEILEVEYYMPPLTEEELAAYDDVTYYGYTVKLYYNGEPMDCSASPPVLLLIEQMRSSKPSYFEGYENNLFPPVDDAVPMSDFMSPSNPDAIPELDSGLLPP